MAKHTPKDPKRPRYSDAEKIVAIFADTHVIAHSGNAFTLYFFQSQVLPETIGEDTSQAQPSEYTCVARIAMSDRTFDGLLRAMAKNRGVTIEPTQPIPPNTKQE